MVEYEVLASPASAVNGLALEVREFLAGLRLESPELFAPERTPAAALPAPSREAAAAVLAERASFWSERIGVRFDRIRVKDQRSLWGSCSRAGNLNFNWRLSAAPPAVMDYVVIHELVHLIEMNHSRRFWRHVERFCPDYRERRRWLRERGRELFDKLFV